VWSLDRSAHALASARRNFERNRALPAVAAARHETVRADAFAALADLARDREAFDVVVIDPPSFAARRAQVEAALGSYARLAHLGLQVLEPGGRIVLASCSHAVDPAAFRETVIAAARRAGRPLRELAEFGQPLDHPTDFAEGRYLKCLFAVA
jgi:23S rRNA (cytosine1962-C5)-methyltransferase